MMSIVEGEHRIDLVYMTGVLAIFMNIIYTIQYRSVIPVIDIAVISLILYLYKKITKLSSLEEMILGLIIYVVFIVIPPIYLTLRGL